MPTVGARMAKCLFLWLLIASSTSSASSIVKSTVPGNTIPFELSEKDLQAVEITLYFSTQKKNAGAQEIILSGKGSVILQKRIFLSQEPVKKQGVLERKSLIALLALMEEENFMGLEERYPFKSEPTTITIIELKLPNRNKRVVLEEGFCPEFERTRGAIKAAAGMAIPEALGHQFFPHL